MIYNGELNESLIESAIWRLENEQKRSVREAKIIFIGLKDNEEYDEETEQKQKQNLEDIIVNT